MRRKYIYCLILAFVFAAVLLSFSGKRASAAETTYSFTIEGTSIADITGTVGQEIQERVYTISFNGGLSLHKPLEAGKDISNWFTGKTSVLPAGITVTVKEDAPIGATSLKVAFSGKTWGASRDELAMRAKRMYFIDGSTNGVEWIDVTFTNSTVPKFNIVRNFSLPSGYCGVGLFVYFKTSDGVSSLSQTSGWKLRGEAGKALTSNNELNVYINGNFIKPYDAGADISAWFTGNLIYTNTQTYEVTHSFLPNGVKATLKNKINVGDSSFTIVFSGIPEQGSNDLIALTIPAGATTHPITDGSLGDSTTAIQVNNITGKFSYKITSEEGTGLQEYVKITYPEAEITVGKTYTEADNLIATYELVGKDSNGNPLVFENVKVGDPLHGITVSGQIHYDGGLKDNIGLTGTVKSFSSDRRIMYVVLTGTVKDQRKYPYTITTYRFALNWTSVNADGRFVNGYDAGESKFKVVIPESDIKIELYENMINAEYSDGSRYLVDYDSDIISASYHVGDAGVTYTNALFWIDLGDDELAVSLSKGQFLPVFGPSGDTTWSGVRIQTDAAYSAGTKRFQVRIYVSPSYIAANYSGFLSISLPKSYLKNMTAYGTESRYYVECNRIYVDFEVRDVIEIQTDAFNIRGKVDYEETHEQAEIIHTLGDGSTFVQTYDKLTGIDIKPVGKERINFTVTLDPIVYVPQDYSEGDSLAGFLWVNTSELDANPFANQPLSSVLPSGLKFAPIRAAEDIQKGYGLGDNPRTLHVYIDLNELTPVTGARGKLAIRMNAKTKRKDYRTDYDSEFVIGYDVLTPYQWSLIGGMGGSGSGSGTLGDGGIDYSSQADVILYAKDADGNEVTGTYINMTTEILVTDLSYNCYSIDGGAKWKTVNKPLTDKQVASMLNKGMTLVLADKYDKKAKKPADDATVYSFSAINKRPATPKLKAEYSAYADETGETAGQWALADNKLVLLSAAEIAKLEIAVQDGKNISEEGFGVWPSQGGLAIKELDSKGKTVKATYYVRVKATADAPASKMVKINVTGQQKAPNLKIDYKKESIKGKVNISITCNGDFIAKNMSKDEAKTAVDISGLLSASSNAEFRIWICATNKKPASAVQTVSAAKRYDTSKFTELSSVAEFNSTKHTVKLAKGFEAYDPAKNRWGSLPKITGDCVIKVRRKADAKGGKENATTYATSEDVYLVITWGITDKTKGKYGITGCELSIDEPTE